MGWWKDQAVWMFGVRGGGDVRLVALEAVEAEPWRDGFVRRLVNVFDLIGLEAVVDMAGAVLVLRKST